jgi:hypothetical protein
MVWAGCGDGDDDGVTWLEVTEESLIGDWCYEDYCTYETYLKLWTLAPDGAMRSESFERIFSDCNWMEWYLSGEYFWHVSGKDTLSIKSFGRNASCWFGCEGYTTRFLAKVSSKELRVKIIDYILTSGDTIPLGYDYWETYNRIDGARRKEELKESAPLPVVYKDNSLMGLGWVNSDGESLKFWIEDRYYIDYLDDSGIFEYDVFVYVGLDSETGDFTDYLHLNTGDGCDPGWYTVRGADVNRLVLKNVTISGLENLGDFEFEYTITTTGFDDILKMRRLINGEPAGDFKTYERQCNAGLCGDYYRPAGNLSKRSGRLSPKPAKCRSYDGKW